MVKSLKYIVKTSVFEDLAGSISKSMKNQCIIYAPRSDAKIKKNGWKMEAKLEPKSTKCEKKRGLKNDANKRGTSAESSPDVNLKGSALPADPEYGRH